jgi:hypothetical protein
MCTLGQALREVFDGLWKRKHYGDRNTALLAVLSPKGRIRLSAKPIDGVCQSSASPSDR